MTRRREQSLVWLAREWRIPDGAKIVHDLTSTSFRLRERGVQALFECAELERSKLRSDPPKWNADQCLYEELRRMYQREELLLLEARVTMAQHAA